jgi:hypothetical protein
MTVWWQQPRAKWEEVPWEFFEPEAEPRP